MLNLYTKCVRNNSLRIIHFPIKALSEDANGRESQLQKQLREELARDKKALKWRKSNHEAGDIDTKLKLFANQEQTSDYIIMMQKPITLNPKDWLAMWDKKKEREERHMQQFVPERHEILGPDLATAHFILHRGGAVKFLNSQNWMRADENGEFNLPNTHNPQFKVEALRCDNMKLYYEGLENIRWLQHLKFISFRNIKTFDDWCLDRISGSQCNKLEILDISNTSCTSRGLSCLYRLNNLKLLIVDDPKSSLEYELTCSMLEESLPNLQIVAANSVHDT